ncbi:MAG TPA: 4,5-DOPA dioxygenase extradiol [Bacteroidales bacterium]|nr:4,5-DOPA dioxygenase extradiol [Bacteroidales bacterium]
MPENTVANPFMPVLFVGHGSPMNAIEENEFVKGWRMIASSIPRPEAILCISAHWETRGTMLTAMEHPRTIHDFGGFPRELYNIQYPAPGNPELASEIKEGLRRYEAGLNTDWGLDHGCWSVLARMYPEADVPIVQMSLDYSKSPRDHYETARDLAGLRKKGILVIGSGNIVHNLRLIDWSNGDKVANGFEWAIEANEKMKGFIIEGDHKSLINFKSQGRPFELAIPTPEHFLPLLYILALKKESEKIEFFNDEAVMGSLTMTSVKIG